MDQCMRYTSSKGVRITLYSTSLGTEVLQVNLGTDDDWLFGAVMAKDIPTLFSNAECYTSMDEYLEYFITTPKRKDRPNG